MNIKEFDEMKEKDLNSLSNTLIYLQNNVILLSEQCYLIV